MSNAHKPRRPRWLPTADTMILARSRAAKMPAPDRDVLKRMLRDSASALRQGTATELHWSILAGALDLANTIERGGIVRGMAGHLATAETALQAIHDRAKITGTWKPTALHYHELDAVATFVDLHAFQIDQLGRIEFLRAVNSTTSSIRANGGTVTVVRDFERMGV